MKALLINGSPHGKGCTYTALKQVADALEEDDIEAEIIHVGQKDVRGCVCCLKCRETGKCQFDDIVNEVAPKFEAADALVIGAPTYYASPNGTALTFMDRLFYSTHFDKSWKVGAAVVTARRGGNTANFDALNKYFTISQMPIASSTYWNQIHGSCAEEAEQDAEGLQTMRTLGHNIAFLVKAIKLAKEQGIKPTTEPKQFTNFIR